MIRMSKTKKYANGTVIVTNFNKLNPDDFIMYDLDKDSIKDKSLLCANNGILYINSKLEDAATLAASVFELLIRESKETLLGFQRTYQKKYPDIKNWDDFETMEGTKEDRINVFAMLSIPAELKRREIEAKYRGKLTAFR